MENTAKEIRVLVICRDEAEYRALADFIVRNNALGDDAGSIPPASKVAHPEPVKPVVKPVIKPKKKEEVKAAGSGRYEKAEKLVLEDGLPIRAACAEAYGPGKISGVVIAKLRKALAAAGKKEPVEEEETEPEESEEKEEEENDQENGGSGDEDSGDDATASSHSKPSIHLSRRVCGKILKETFQELVNFLSAYKDKPDRFDIPTLQQSLTAPDYAMSWICDQLTEYGYSRLKEELRRIGIRVYSKRDPESGLKTFEVLSI